MKNTHVVLLSHCWSSWVCLMDCALIAQKQSLNRISQQHSSVTVHVGTTNKSPCPRQHAHIQKKCANPQKRFPAPDITPAQVGGVLPSTP